MVPGSSPSSRTLNPLVSYLLSINFLGILASRSHILCAKLNRDIRYRNCPLCSQSQLVNITIIYGEIGQLRSRYFLQSNCLLLLLLFVLWLDLNANVRNNIVNTCQPSSFEQAPRLSLLIMSFFVYLKFT